MDTQFVAVSYNGEGDFPLIAITRDVKVLTEFVASEAYSHQQVTVYQQDSSGVVLLRGRELRKLENIAEEAFNDQV